MPKRFNRKNLHEQLEEKIIKFAKNIQILYIVGFGVNYENKDLMLIRKEHKE